MKQDILIPEVQDVLVAVVPRDGKYEEEIWDIYVINLRKDPMDNVLITSQGYGMIDGSDKSTTVLRHFHQRLDASVAVKVEPIQKELFAIQNEYWISFNDKEVMLDKKFIFKANTITPDKMEMIPVLGKVGVMIK
ncbi:hypothetical protein [Neolewinella agarilytica]|uniref:Uncharacterized protein n=1 Tax=Neolewinella agarilytica TaxID=478744 RepID=A0A1H8Z9K9_9BACT|nr:hypothetical protein [Neolewinella agarilytica]SEP61159.1 hypothetical protein SAMN05444359_101234 [Neolewinella agarilytica]